MTMSKLWAARAIALLMLMPAGAALQAQDMAGWTGELTIRYESSGQREGKPGEQRGPDTLVSERDRWRVEQTIRATLAYTQKVKGAVASGMPDRNNEARYDSWLSRPKAGRQPAAMQLSAERVTDRAARLGKADGEGASELNRERAGKLGRVEHRRERLTLAADGPEAAVLQGGGFVQIDRHAGKLHLELGFPRMVAEATKVVRSQAVSIDTPPPADHWDSQRELTPADAGANALSIPQLPLLEFDVPKDADSFEVSQTVPLGGGFPGRAQVSLKLRRSAGTAAATATPAQPAATVLPTAPPSPAAAPVAAKARADCPPPKAAGDATTAGAEVGGKLLGGGHGRQVGAAVGSLLGALGGPARKAESTQTTADCPR